MYSYAKLWTGPGMAAAPSVLASTCLLFIAPFNSLTCFSWIVNLSISLKHDFHTYPSWNLCTSRCDLLVPGTWRSNNFFALVDSAVCYYAIITFHQHKSLYAKSPDPLSSRMGVWPTRLVLAQASLPWVNQSGCVHWQHAWYCKMLSFPVHNNYYRMHSNNINFNIASWFMYYLIYLITWTC